MHDAGAEAWASRWPTNPIHARNHAYCAMRRRLGMRRAMQHSEDRSRRRKRPRSHRLRIDQNALSNIHQRGPHMQRRTFIRRVTLAATLAAVGITMGVPAQAADTIKVGVLHSLSGTMAISETVAQGRRADDDRRDQRQGRRDGQEARSRRRRSGVELAALRREGAPAHFAGQGGRGLRLLDFGFAQVGAAGLRGD